MGKVDVHELKKFFSSFWGIEINKVTDDLKLDDSNLKDQTSIKMFQFFAELEKKFKVKVLNVQKILVFKNIRENIK